MPGVNNGARPTFQHRWATRICRDSPWYRRSANRVMSVTVNGDELASTRMFPALAPGFDDVHVPLRNLVKVERTTYAIPGLGFRIPTVTVEYRDAAGSIQSLEHIFTTLGPFSLVTTPGRRADDFIAALESGRSQVTEVPGTPQDSS